MLVESQQTRRRLARNIPVYYLFYAVSGFLIWMPIWVIYLQDFRGMSLTQVAAIESIFWITVVVAEVPTGAVADRWGRRVSLAFAGGIFCLGSVVFAFSSTYVILLVAYVTVALAMTLYSGAGHALVYDTLRQLGRTREYEKHIGRSEALAFGSMLMATLLAGPLVALAGYPATILAGAAAMGVAGLIALFLREPPRSEAEFTGQQPGHDGSTAAPRTPGLFSNVLGGVLVVWRSKLLLWYILAATLLSGVIMVSSDFLLQPFVVHHGVDPASGGRFRLRLLGHRDVPGCGHARRLADSRLGRQSVRRATIAGPPAVRRLPHLPGANPLGLALGGRRDWIARCRPRHVSTHRHRLHQPSHPFGSARNRAVNVRAVGGIADRHHSAPGRSRRRRR